MTFRAAVITFPGSNCDRDMAVALEKVSGTPALRVAHHDGNYFADDATLDRLEGEGRVAFRYADECNGSQRRIAGILNPTGTVLGMMPHPERAIEPELGGSDGRALFESAVRGLVAA